MATGGARVEIRGLEVGYGRDPVLNGVDLDMAPGRFVALLGASGCGKTTLLRAVSGFLPVARGRILIDGTDVTEAPPERRPTAMVFQSYALWPHMSVAANIGYGLRLRRLGRAAVAARVAEILTLLGLDGFGERKVTSLSGGQRQRVALGRALAIDPPVLLLDEPLSNLDAKIRHAMRAEIRAIQERLGLTTILVTHDQEEAMVMADRILVMDRGHIVQDGTPEEVYRHPNSPFVANFLGADNVISATARVADGRTELTLADGSCVAATAAGPIDGPVFVHFRSAAVRFGEDAPAGLTLAGRVVQASYPGGRHRYTVATAAGTFSVEDARRAVPGETVVITVPQSDLHVFASTGAADARAR